MASENMLRAEFTGVLRGAAGDAYAQMDIFAFPSETDTVGNVVLEAMASGVPVGRHGPRRPPVHRGARQTASIASVGEPFIQHVRTLVRNRRPARDDGRCARAGAIRSPHGIASFFDVCNADDMAISTAEGEGRNP